MRMLTATALARISGATRFTMAELIGPVDENSSNSASTSAVQYTTGLGASNATSPTGAATSVATPETHRYAWRVRAGSRSATHPPTVVPTRPVATSTRPDPTVVILSVRPRIRIRNLGRNTAMPPSANV